MKQDKLFDRIAIGFLILIVLISGIILSLFIISAVKFFFKMVLIILAFITVCWIVGFFINKKFKFDLNDPIGFSEEKDNNV